MYKIYQVEYGDTIDIIAQKSNTTRENIKMLNNLNDTSELIVGSLIVVPRESDNFFENYKVNKGDSIYSISRMYDVSPETLLKLNGLNKNDYIYPNQEIIVPVKGISLYVTKEGDTISEIIKNFGVDANRLINENNKIFVVEDQLIISKKE